MEGPGQEKRTMKLINASAGVHHRNGRPPDDSDLWVPLPKGTAPSELPPPETERQRDRLGQRDRMLKRICLSVSLCPLCPSVSGEHELGSKPCLGRFPHGRAGG